ncbi:MAG: MtnX-like HAD-IB family phosphatase, partial [Anaerolineae bacterium]
MGKGLGSKVAVLCDFDGTITPCIVIDMLYRQFAAPSCLEIVKLWEEGKVSTPQEMRACFGTITATRAEMEALLASVPVDPAFADLLEFCRQRGYHFAIVSDGLTWYIQYILHRHGIHDVTIYASEIHFGPDGLHLSFPWYSPETPLRGTSKLALVRRYKESGFQVVFVGDGLSDIEVVGAVDRLYARASLLDYCREHGSPAIPFSDLHDVLEDLCQCE